MQMADNTCKATAQEPVEDIKDNSNENVTDSSSPSVISQTEQRDKDLESQSPESETPQAQNNEDPERKDSTVDMMLGAGAHALNHSLLMFGDPKQSTSADDDEKTGSGAENDVDGNEKIPFEDSFVHEDDKDVTHHDDNFNIDVRMRLVTSDDEKGVRALIYDGIYITAMHRMMLNAMERPFIICFIGLCAVLFAWLFGAIILSLFLSVVGVPLLFYIYIRYFAMAIYRRRNLPELSTGVYEYWSATDQGRVMWVAELDNKIVGVVAVETHSAIVAEMKHLVVTYDFQCLGIGGNLANHALTHIRRRRFKRVIAHVMSIHSEAVNMYTKLGFRRTNIRKVLSGLCTVEDFDLNLGTGSRAALNVTEE